MLSPLNLVLLSRERIQEAVDEAVERGRMTREDATDLVAGLVRHGRKQTNDVLADLEQLLGRSREGLTGTVTRARKSGTVDRVVRSADRARRVAGVGPAFPILGYDDLTAAQVAARLSESHPRRAAQGARLRAPARESQVGARGDRAEAQLDAALKVENRR